MKKFHRTYLLILLFAPCFSTYAPQSIAAAADVDGTTLADRISIIKELTFPRISTITYAGRYDSPKFAADLAQFDLVIIGTAAPIPDFIAEIKNHNPRTLIGLYTVLNEARKSLHTPLARERLEKIEGENWWLRDANGTQLQWTPQFDTWDINVTRWVKPDAEGKHYPEWVAGFWYRNLFKPMPKADIWFFDNVFIRQRLKAADWKLSGSNQNGNASEITAEFRAAQRTEIDIARRLAPNVLMVGNADNDLSLSEYRGALNGALMECLMGQKWSVESRLGWKNMMDYYRTVTDNLAPPSLTIFGVCPKDLTDYRAFRYAFTSALMGDAYFQIADQSATYRNQAWFDEFSIDIGGAIDSPFPSVSQDGVFIRKFERGLVVVNPTDVTQNVSIPTGYRRILGKQDPEINTGQVVVDSVAIRSKDGLVLVKR
jgi:hypothetical protein